MSSLTGGFTTGTVFSVLKSILVKAKRSKESTFVKSQGGGFRITVTRGTLIFVVPPSARPGDQPLAPRSRLKEIEINTSTVEPMSEPETPVSQT